MEQVYDLNEAAAKTQKLFPYPTPNAQQVQIINAILKLPHKGILMVEAATGSGKTIASMSALLARRNPDEKIIVITRTISQMEPIVREWAKIVGGFEGLKFGDKPLILPILGKAKLCKQLPILQLTTTFDSRAVHILCKSMDCELYPFSKSSGYSYYHDFEMSAQQQTKNHRRLLLNTNFALVGKKKHGGSAIEKIYQIYGKHPSCGYYDQRELIRHADIIILTYGHLQPQMMSSIIKSTGVNISKIYFLIDEAHNLSTTKKTVLMKSDLEFVSRFIGELVVLRKMREAMRTNERLYPEMFGKDEEWAALRTILNESNDKIRKRYNFTLWDISKPEFQRLNSFIMSRYSGDIISYSDRLEIIETSPELKLNEINDAKLQVYQSGTFSPIQYYKSLYGLSRAKTLVTTPETKENQFRCYLKGPLTSAKRRRQPKMYRAMAAAIKAIHAASPRHVLVICPSYEFVNMLSGFLKGIINPKIIHTEAPKVNIDILSGVMKYQVIPQIFVAVSSGKISEGVEIVVDGISLLSVVIFAGIPIAPPSKDQTIVKRAYMQASHNPRAADEFMRAIPLERAVRQAYGRTIRAMHDKGALVILDYRAENYLKKLLKLEKYISLKRLNDDLTGFFEGYQTLEELRELRQVKRIS